MSEQRQAATVGCADYSGYRPGWRLMEAEVAGVRIRAWVLGLRSWVLGLGIWDLRLGLTQDLRPKTQAQSPQAGVPKRVN